MGNDQNENSWSLEIVRGTDSGHRLPLGQGTVFLGNALNGSPGIDLSNLEVNAPRKMAGKHAQLEVQNGFLRLRDLNSPGGTFVDRRRVPPGSDLPLKDGDVIQLGAVQLRVVRGNGAVVRPPVGAVLTLKSGVTCRTWDEVLTVVAQRWSELRDELISGSLASSLIASGNSALAPNAHLPGSPDERLDAWIGQLPTSRPAKPELDVHPRSLVVRAIAGGGVIRKKVQISNVGYRLLRTTVRVEPRTATWLRIAPDFEAKTFSTVDHTELLFDVTMPDSAGSLMTACLVVESNGGTASIAIRVEPASAKEIAIVSEPGAESRSSIRFREWIASQPLRSRLLALSGLTLAFRALVAIAAWTFPQSGTSPSLMGPLVVFACLGSLAGVRLGIKGADWRDYPWLAVGGGLIGAFVSAVTIAVFRTIETPIGIPNYLAIPAWGAIGAALAFASSVIIPPTSMSSKEPKP